MPLCTHLQRGRTSQYKPTQVYTSWCLRITGFHWRWAATSASRVGMRAGSRRPGLYVRMYPCARGENYFVTRTIVTCELLAGCWMLPPLSRCPFGKYCVAGCPSTCGIYGDWCNRHHSGWQECKRHCPCPIARPVPSGQSNINSWGHARRVHMWLGWSIVAAIPHVNGLEVRAHRLAFCNCINCMVL